MKRCCVCGNVAAECVCGMCPEGDRPPADEWQPATVSVDAAVVFAILSAVAGWLTGRFLIF